MKKKEKIEIITLGCSKNIVDSERLMKQFKINQIELVNTSNNADSIVINTCGFIESAKEESINTILKAIELKKAGKIKKVVVAGCLSERYKDELRKEIPEVDAYFGIEDYDGIINEFGGNLKKELLGERLISTPKHYAYLKISEGCDNPCSFCAIPLIRGKYKSKPIEKLVAETELLAVRGVKEIIIIAQDTTDYGRDLYGKQMLSELLEKLSKIDQIKWIRLLYTYPSRFPENVMDLIAVKDNICNYIDLPLQHISDVVLKSMRRGISSKKTRELLYKLKNKIPNLTLRTTFIVGYPNETEKEFEELINFVKEFEFDRLGVFTYSAEEDTYAFSLNDIIAPEEKQRRKEILMEIQKGISLKKNNAFIGKKIEVLIDNIEGNYYIGRSERDAPEVDGEVLIPAENNQIKIGNYYSVEIVDCNEYDLFGKFLK